MLVAIMLVALATIIAATIGYDSAMAARRATGTYAFDQSILIAEGAEGLAAYALKQVWQNAANGGRTTNPNQAWAMPVGPLEIVPGVNLDAQMQDLQGRFNVNSLVKPSPQGALVADPEARRAFETLLGLLQIPNPTHWSAVLIDWIDPDIQPQQPDGAEDSFYLGQVPPYFPPNKYITSITELLALGFGENNYQRLAPYITALPPDAKINVCTASPYVLDAFLPGRQEYSRDLESFEKSRAAAADNCYPAFNDFTAVYNQANPTGATASTVAGSGQTTGGVAGATASSGVAPMSGGPARLSAAGGAGAPVPTGMASYFQVTSSYFRLSSHVTTGDGIEFNVYSLMYQDPSQGTARPILRSFTPD